MKKKIKSWFYRLARWSAARSGLQGDLDRAHQYHLHCHLQRQSDELMKQIDTLRDENSTLWTQVAKLEQRTQQNMAHNANLQFLEARGDKPVLWVCGDASMHNAGAFARLTDRIKKICPRIDLIIFTPYGTKLQELDDKELFDMGLARIFPLENAKIKQLENAKTKQLAEANDVCQE